MIKLKLTNKKLDMLVKSAIVNNKKLKRSVDIMMKFLANLRKSNLQSLMVKLRLGRKQKLGYQG